MSTDIETKLKDYDECGTYRDKSGREPQHDEEVDLADLCPWDHIFLDFASIQETGKKRWLVMADCYSRFIHTEYMGLSATTPMVWGRLMKLCCILGFP